VSASEMALMPLSSGYVNEPHTMKQPVIKEREDKKQWEHLGVSSDKQINGVM
jgi:hypothetical protein